MMIVFILIGRDSSVFELNLDSKLFCNLNETNEAEIANHNQVKVNDVILGEIVA